MNTRLSLCVALFACAAFGACARTPHRPSPQRPGVWTFGYTMREDPAALTSQVSNCLYVRMDPTCMEELRGAVRFLTTTRELAGGMNAYFSQSERRIVYREQPAGFVEEEIIVHEVLHWVYSSDLAPERELFSHDLELFLEEFGALKSVADINACWNATIRVRGPGYEVQRVNEYYAYIGGWLAKRGFHDDVGTPGVVPEYFWRHYRGVLAPALRRWREPGEEELALALSGVIAPVTSVVGRKLAVGHDEFDVFHQYGGIIVSRDGGTAAVSSDAAIDRFAPSQAAITSLSAGHAYVPPRAPPQSIEFKVRLPVSQRAAWNALAHHRDAGRACILLREAEGEVLHKFIRADIVWTGVNTDGWMTLRLPGSEYSRVRRLFSAYDEGLLVSEVVEPVPR